MYVVVELLTASNHGYMRIRINIANFF